jgi:hypothetical protein
MKGVYVVEQNCGRRKEQNESVRTVPKKMMLPKSIMSTKYAAEFYDPAEREPHEICA